VNETDDFEDEPTEHPVSARNGSPEGLEMVPGLARLALSAGWRTAEWAARTSLRVPGRLADVARDPRKALGRAHEILGAVPGQQAEPTPHDDGRPERSEDSSRVAHDAPTETLQEAGEVLLRLSRDVHYEEHAHPAYARILSELAPDEGRILRLLLLDGPQPAVDIRTGGPLGMVRSRLLAPGLSMIGARAGCRYRERVPSYLNNLFRLGMVWFSRETLRDPLRYQVLEAQPDVLEAIRSVRQAKVVRRSIHLTPFGEDFCRVCLTPNTTVIDELPRHSSPSETAITPQPPTQRVDG
jgi:Abortive infection alpha